MNREVTLQDTVTTIQAAKRKSGELKSQDDISIVGLIPQPHFQVFAMSSSDDFFWRHPNSVFAIFFGATSAVLLVLMFVLWVGQQVW